MSRHEHIPKDLAKLYEIYDYRHAAAILACEFPAECAEVFGVLRSFRFSQAQLLKSGGNESDIPKIFSKHLRPLGWKEGQLKARLLVDDEELTADTHKIDFIKNKIAFDLEWNSKD